MNKGKERWSWLFGLDEEGDQAEEEEQPREKMWERERLQLLQVKRAQTTRAKGMGEKKNEKNTNNGPAQKEKEEGRKKGGKKKHKIKMVQDIWAIRESKGKGKEKQLGRKK